MRVAVNQGSLETCVIAKCPGRFVADDPSWRIIEWRIVEGLLYTKNANESVCFSFNRQSNTSSPPPSRASGAVAMENVAVNGDVGAHGSNHTQAVSSLQSDDVTLLAPNHESQQEWPKINF